MKRLRSILETRIFGVSSFLGELFGIPSNHIRLLFIYATFLTFGSPIFIYLSIAFLLKVKKMIRRKKPSIWDL